MTVKYHTFLGTIDQINEIKSIIGQFSSIKAIILDCKIILPRTTPEDKRELYYYELELTAPIEDHNKYFEALAKCPNVFFNEVTKFTS